MITALQIARFLDKTLQVAAFEDRSHNGLQVANQGDIPRICCGVDASLDFFRAAQARGAGLLICHHNAQICATLGMKSLKPFGMYHGQYIGFGGRLPRPMPYARFVSLVKKHIGPARCMPFGKSAVQSVAVVSGGVADHVAEASEQGYDIFLFRRTLRHRNLRGKGTGETAIQALSRACGIRGFFDRVLAPVVSGFRRGE